MTHFCRARVTLSCMRCDKCECGACRVPLKDADSLKNRRVVLRLRSAAVTRRYPRSSLCLAKVQSPGTAHRAVTDGRIALRESVVCVCCVAFVANVVCVIVNGLRGEPEAPSPAKPANAKTRPSHRWERTRFRKIWNLIAKKQVVSGPRESGPVWPPRKPGCTGGACRRTSGRLRPGWLPRLCRWEAGRSPR